MNNGPQSHWSQIAELSFVVDGYELESLAVDESSGYERVSTHFRLRGGGADGLGEDIWPFAEDQEALLSAGPSLPLAGEWTMGAFCAHLAALDQWPEPPSWEAARRYRNWAFESAALDLALRQNKRALPELLGLEPRPVRFVNSLGLGDPPSFDAIARRLARYPELRFKLDADPRWTPDLMDELVVTDAVGSAMSSSKTPTTSPASTSSLPPTCSASPTTRQSTRPATSTQRPSPRAS